MKIRSLVGIGVAALTGAAVAQPAGTEFVSAGLFSQTANFLDDSFNVLGTFDTGGSPNGAAVGGGQIFIGDFGIPGWNVYNIDGTFVQTVTAGVGQHGWGITYANGDILIRKTRPARRHWSSTPLVGWERSIHPHRGERGLARRRRMT